jgi:hypothetical protein
MRPVEYIVGVQVETGKLKKAVMTIEKWTDTLPKRLEDLEALVRAGRAIYEKFESIDTQNRLADCMKVVADNTEGQLSRDAGELAHLARLSAIGMKRYDEEQEEQERFARKYYWFLYDI